MENISFQIFRICIFVYATELQNIQLLSVPEPCPDTADSTTIADMCTADFASEDPNTGGTTVDSVALRVMTQQDGCTCELSLQNQYNTHTIYMRKYDLLTSAGPVQDACGLAIDIGFISADNFPENNDPIECTKGISTRSVSLSQSGVLNLRSRIIGGNFSRGYCIQIYRHERSAEEIICLDMLKEEIMHSSNYIARPVTSSWVLRKEKLLLTCKMKTGHFQIVLIEYSSANNVGIQINCTLSNMQTTQQEKTVSRNMKTTQHMTDAAIKHSTVASNMQTPQQMTEATIVDKTVSDTGSTIYIAIGVGFAVVVIALFVVVAVLISRRKGNKNKNGIEVQPHIDSTDDDSDGLKYNTLYNTSEQQDIMEGDYHTVDIESKPNYGIQNFDSDYSTVDHVDGNYSSIDLVNIPVKDDSKTDSGMKSSSTTTPHRTKEVMSNNLKHVTAGNNVKYAVVDKSHKTDVNIKHVTAPNDSNVEYAVIDKPKSINN